MENFVLNYLFEFESETFWGVIVHFKVEGWVSSRIDRWIVFIGNDVMVLPVSGGVLWCVSVQMYSECPLSCPRVPTHWHQHQCLSLQSPVASDTVLTRDPRADRQHRHVNYHQTCPILRLKTTRPPWAQAQKKLKVWVKNCLIPVTLPPPPPPVISSR